MQRQAGAGKLQHAGLKSRPLPSSLGSGGKRGATGVAAKVAGFERLSSPPPEGSTNNQSNGVGKKKSSKSKKQSTSVNFGAAASCTYSDADDESEEQPPLPTGAGNETGAKKGNAKPVNAADYDDSRLFDVTPLAVLHPDRSKLLQIISGMVKDQVQRRIVLSSDPFYNYVRKVAGALMNAQTPDDLLHMAESNVHQKFMQALQKLEDELHPHASQHATKLTASSAEIQNIKGKIMQELALMEQSVRTDKTERALVLNRHVGELLSNLQKLNKEGTEVFSKRRRMRGLATYGAGDEESMDGWHFVVTLQRQDKTELKEEYFRMSGLNEKNESDWYSESTKIINPPPPSAQEVETLLRDKLLSGEESLSTDKPLHPGLRFSTKTVQFALLDMARNYLDNGKRRTVVGWIAWFREKWESKGVLSHIDRDTWRLPKGNTVVAVGQAEQKVFYAKQFARDTTQDDAKMVARYYVQQGEEEATEFYGTTVEERLLNMYKVNHADYRIQSMLRDTVNTLASHAIPHEYVGDLPQMWAHPRPSVEFYTRPGNFDDRIFYLRPDLEIAAGKALEGVREAYVALEQQQEAQSGLARHALELQAERMWEDDVVVDFASLTALYLNIQERMSAKRYYSTVDTQFRMMEVNNIRERVGRTLLQAGCTVGSSGRGKGEVLDWRLVMHLDGKSRNDDQQTDDTWAQHLKDIATKEPPTSARKKQRKRQ